MSQGYKGPPQDNIDSILLAISRRDNIDADTLSHYFSRLEHEWLDGARDQVLHLLRGNDASGREAALFILAEIATRELDLEVLEDFVTDPTVSDIVKLSLAPILKEIDSEMIDDGLVEYLNDPSAAMQQMQLRLLRLVDQSEMGVESVLKDVLSMSVERRISFVQWLGNSNDSRATRLLIPLLENQSSKVVAAVIEALEQLGSNAVQQSLPALNYLITTTSNRALKQQARAALGRLTMQSALGTEDAVMRGTRQQHLPQHEARVSFVDGSGSQLIMLSWLRTDGLLKGVNILYQDQWGIKDCYGIDEMDVARWNDLVDDLDDQGFNSFHVPFEFARALIAEARSISKRTRHKLPIAYAIWRPLLENAETRNNTNDPYRALLGAQAPTTDTLVLAQRGAELYLLPEFLSWMYEDAQRVEPFMNRYWSAYHALQLNNQSKGAKRRNTRRETPQDRERKVLLEELVSESLIELADEQWRTLYAARLRRQAALFKLAKREEDAALTAACAAILHPMSHVPVQEQSFPRALMRFSIEHGPLRLIVDSIARGNTTEMSIFPFDDQEN